MMLKAEEAPSLPRLDSTSNSQLTTGTGQLGVDQGRCLLQAES